MTEMLIGNLILIDIMLYIVTGMNKTRVCYNSHVLTQEFVIDERARDELLTYHY